MLINNAGLGRITSSVLDPSMIDDARAVFETNFYGTILVSQAFAPILAGNGGGAIINVLSDAVCDRGFGTMNLASNRADFLRARPRSL